MYESEILPMTRIKKAVIVKIEMVAPQ